MRLLNHLKIKTKISLLSLAMFLILVLVGATSIGKLVALNQLLDEVYESHMTPIVNIGKVKSDIEDIRSVANELLDARDDASAREEALQSIDTLTATLLEDQSQLSDMDNYTEIKTAIDAYLATKDVFVEQSASMGVPAAEPATEISTEISTELTLESTTDSVAPAETAAQDTSFISSFDDARNNVVTLLEDSIQKMVSAAEQNQSESGMLVRKSVLSTGVLVLISILLTVLLTLNIGSSIVKPLKQVTQKLKDISQNEGDLTQRLEIKSKDELGDLSRNFNAFADKLSSILSEVSSASELIHTSSTVIKTVTETQTQSMESLSASVIEITSLTSDNASVLKTMNGQIQSSSDLSTQTSYLSSHASTQASQTKATALEGTLKIEEVVSAMTQISEASKGVVHLVNDLDASSQKIGNIITMISAISDQTNLLALNASIEAARAGEAGRGFTVVANEIKKLADESKEASRQISELVIDNQSKSSIVVSSVENVETVIAMGETKANQVGLSIQEMITGIEEMVNMIDQIKVSNTSIADHAVHLEAAMTKMVASSGEIAEGTETISGTIEEQLSTMIELDDASSKLNALAVKLNSVMGGFKV